MKYIIKPSAVLFITAVIVTALLSFAHSITLEPIAAQAKRTLDNAMKEVLPQASEFQEIQVETAGRIVRVFEGLNGGQHVGYVLELSSKGYGGAIEMLAGISSDDEKLAGIRILKHSESAGLGALIVNESFYHKFDNINLTPLTVVKTNPAEGEIDAITSATITTRAVTEAVNEAMEWYAAFSLKKGA